MIAIYFVGASSLMALVFAIFISVRVRREPRENPEVLRISGVIQKGTNAYLRCQYKGVGILSAAVLVILLVVTFYGFLSFFTPFAFLTDGFFSGLPGFIGMRATTMADCRTAQEASRNLNRGLGVAFSADSVVEFTVVDLDLLDLTAWYLILNVASGALPDSQRIAQITANMLASGMGASGMALFARVGGDTFTKVANVGIDLVGKAEAGIPEGDPRNPTVIADNVGDDAGDMAGMDAGLYESYMDPIVPIAALAVATGYGGEDVTIPVILAALGVLASILGTFFAKTEEGVSQKNLLKALRTGTYISVALMVAAAHAVIRILLPDHMDIYAAILSGLITGIPIGAVTEHYMSDTCNPTRELAASSRTGGVTVIISGLSLGILPTVAPAVIVSVSILISYYCSGDSAGFSAGPYGVGASAVGMLSTLGITLAADAYGPVADNAGGIAEVTHMSEEMHQRTDALDSLDNTTAVIGRGFVTSPAIFTALALIVSYIDKVKQIDLSLSMSLSITNSTVPIGFFTGGMLPFLLVAFIMEAAGEAAQSIVVEVHRQFREIEEPMEGRTEPDYGTYVDTCTISAQRPMVAPAMAAVIIPVVVGLLLGPEGVSGLLAGNTVTGLVLVAMMANARGAWDNVKKYIESGQLGGEGNEEHKAAVISDTIGDPFRDASGPSVNVLIKPTSMVLIVFTGLIVAVHLL